MGGGGVNISLIKPNSCFSLLVNPSVETTWLFLPSTNDIYVLQKFLKNVHWFIKCKIW